ncbi:sensor histidine kinase YesM [Pedobacter cryoconitis]|uniref:sensor histidine kinase n=1 Tax=Pedobacter cryoconitis TaxID=188932 RepID=UPI001620BAE5|nr:sensor histidine kinase [Pedobacter cryoconitis]MBB6273774.1 sensor histidine kinase YesM [Pedobacter cryoconitis]
MNGIILAFLKKYKYHFLVWSVFVAYEIFIRWLHGPEMAPAIVYIVAYTLGISVFYLHAHVILKYTLETKSKLLKYGLPLFILVEILFYLVIEYLIRKYIYEYIRLKSTELTKPVHLYIFAKIWRYIYAIGLSTGYYFFLHDLRQRQQVKKMKQQKLKTILLEKEIKNELILTQNALLRAQINPHFLLNTLSYLYNETRKLAPKAAERILSLSDIMQYALSKEASSEYVTLESEIKLIENFLFLYQSRQAYKMQLNLSYNSEALSVIFIPLILMSLTENMIKHGQLDNPLKPAEIKIVYDNAALYINTSNPEAMKNPVSSYNTGLKNISNRLAMAYGEKVVFNSHLDSQNYFHTYIKLELN